MLPYLNLDLKYLKKYAIKHEYIQNTYNLWLKANILYSYKNAFRYEENISYNKFPLIIFEKHAYSPLYKRSSVAYNKNDTRDNFVVINSILPYSKRNFGTIVLACINLRLI